MLKKIGLQILFIFVTVVANAQIPDIIPSGEPEPIELTLFNITLYIVVPILLLVFFLWYRKSKRKKYI